MGCESRPDAVNLACVPCVYVCVAKSLNKLQQRELKAAPEQRELKAALAERHKQPELQD